MADPDLAAYQADGATSALGGVSSALESDMLSGNSQLRWAINAQMRSGKPHTRGAWVERAILQFGNVQGAKFFSLGRGSALIGIKGRLYRVTTEAEEVKVESVPLEGTRSPQVTQMWMEQTTRFMVIQDGISRPLIYNGVFARESQQDEVPLGKQMAYGNGRLWVARGDGGIVAGNIVQAPGTELKFTEDETLFAGGAYQTPGAIRAMKFMPSNEVASSNGPLIVGGVDYTMALKAHITERQQWTNIDGFQTLIFPDQGIISHESLVTSNLDMIFRDGAGGIRTFRQATSDFQDAGTSPISEDISQLTDHESVDMLETCPGIVFNNRLLMGASPFIIHEGQWGFRHIISYDLAPLATRGTQGKPIFDGQWEGFFITHLFKIKEDGSERAFGIGKGLDGDNRLYEYMPDRPADEFVNASGDLVQQPIQWQVEYPELKFTSDLQFKRFRRVDVWLKDIVGTVNIKIYFTSDGLCDWKLLMDEDVCACLPPADSVEEVSLAGDDRRWRDFCKGVLPQMINYEPDEDEVHGEEWMGYRFSFKMVITGQCKIDKMLAWAEATDPPVYSENLCRVGIKPDTCQFVEVRPVAGEYVITQIGDSPQIYVDELGASYIDELAEEYVDA